MLEQGIRGVAATVLLEKDAKADAGGSTAVACVIDERDGPAGGQEFRCCEIETIGFFHSGARCDAL